MVEMLQKHQTSESNKIAIDEDQTKVAKSNELSDSDLIATLKGIKIEEQELLRQRKDLQATESELRNQAIAEIDGKKRVIEGLKSEIAFIQNKYNELEQALGYQSINNS